MKDSTIIGLAFFAGIAVFAIAATAMEYALYRMRLKKMSEQTNKKTNL